MKTLLSRLEFSLLAAAVAYAMYFQTTLPGKLPRDEDYQQVASLLAQEAQPGDMVLLHPFWADKARLFLSPTVPLMGFLGQERNRWEEYARIWVLSAPDMPKAPAAPFLSRTPLLPPRQLGALTLTLFENPHHRQVLFSGADALSSAQVHVEYPDGQRETCSKDRLTFRCPSGASLGKEWHEVIFEPQLCLAVRPPNRGGKLVVNFPHAPAGGILSLQAGLVWDRGYFKHAGLAELKVQAEDAQGTVLSLVSILPGQEGYQKSASHLQAFPSGLRLSVQTANPESREACIKLQVFLPQGET